MSRLALVFALVFVGCLAGLAPAASAEVRWLCRPGLASNPCQGDQTTTYFNENGASRVGLPEVQTNPPIDCFYVYPTVSNQPTPNATQTPDPEVRSIAKYQAQRFSTQCRVYVPLYREVTAAGVTVASQTHDTTPYDTAFTDVREAWLSYLRNDNHGRGVVLIGHSQGSRMLRALIRREIDPKPSVRRLLVSAIIPGANATVATGRRTGGDFAHVPICTAAGQTGCVISYSTFNETPPNNARFGRTDTDPVGGALGLPTGPGLEVICTDPTRLAGTDGGLESLLPSEPFAPGVIAVLLLKLYGGPPPSADTPWLQPQDHYTGRCETSNGAHVLMLSPVGDARKLDPSPDETWGTHLVDLNIALGNLTTVVGAESRAWRLAHRPLAVRLRARGRLLVATVTGPPRLLVRVVVRAAAKRAMLGTAGRRVFRFRVARAGRYRALAHAVGRRTARSQLVSVR